MINEIIQQVEAGEINPLNAYIEIYRLEKQIKAAKEIIQQKAIDEAAKYPEKTFQFMGFEIQKKSGAGRWKFDHLTDWQAKANEIKEIEEKHKQAFKMWEKGDTYITEGGEIVEPAVYMPGADTIALKEIKA